jgi:hypothetical protein
VLALLHPPSHQTPHRRQVHAEVRCDFAIGIGAGGASRHNGGVSASRALGNLFQGWRWPAALRLRDAQLVALNLGFSLHACHERIVSQVALLAQSSPNSLWTVTVADDGLGISEEDVYGPDALGLPGMQERVSPYPVPTHEHISRGELESRNEPDLAMLSVALRALHKLAASAAATGSGPATPNAGA